MIRKSCLLVVVLLCLFFTAAHPPIVWAGTVVVIDDYDDGNAAANTLNFWTGGNTGANYALEEVALYSYHYGYYAPPYTDYSETNKALRLTYDCAKEQETFWYASNLEKGATYLDISDFNYLSFSVKGENGGEDFHIQLQYGDPVGKGPEPFIEIYSADYVAVTKEWQHVTIPLDSFSGLERAKMRSISIIFGPDLAIARGTLYLNNLAFSKGYCKPDSSGAVRIDRAKKALYVDGKLFRIKGVGYQPTPIGQPVYPPIQDDNIYERDFALLKEMGCNTVRTWGEPGKALMDKADTYGLKVIAGFWMDDKLDYTDPRVRESMKYNFKRFVNKYEDEPALLIWALGNECNYSAVIDHASYYALANELAEIAYKCEGGDYHPVMVVNGKLHHIGVADDNALDMQLDYLDAWGANLYARDYHAVDWFAEPRDIFEVYKAKSAKPLVITEYGADAFHTTAVSPETTGYVDEEAQAEWVRRNTRDIMAASDVVLGGCVMAYSDEWWKSWRGGPAEREKRLSVHDPGPAANWYAHQPDHYANEEYWGIVEVGEDGAWSRIKCNKRGDRVDDVRPRKVYYALKELFQQTAPKVTVAPVPEIDSEPVRTAKKAVGADFSAYPTSGAAPLMVYFADKSDGDVKNWWWDFGDGVAIGKQDPSHVYLAEKNYTVTLTVEDSAGNRHMTSKTNFITVYPPLQAKRR